MTRLSSSRKLPQDEAILSRLGIEAGKFVLATVHRAENTDDPARLSNIVKAFEIVASDIPVVLPVHPRTAARMSAAGLSFQKVKTLPPVGYLDMVALESKAALIATDSGGVQKEAFFYEVPCVTLRDETEWTELVEIGWNKLASPGSPQLAALIREALGTRGTDAAPYGDGTAARSIAEVLSR